MVRLLHTTDLHLGVSFKSFGDFGRTVRETLKETFSRVIDLAVREKVDVILIAGDLFDSNDAPSSLVRYVTEQFRRIHYIPICVLPGTHDCYSTDSVYRRQEFEGLRNVFIFKSGAPETKCFSELGLAIHGRANLTNQGACSSLEGLKPDSRARFNVAIAHAAIKIPGRHNEMCYTVGLEEIEESKFDYIALGDWHKCKEYSKGKTKAWYAGSPETIQFGDGEESGYVLLVNLLEKGVNIEKKKIGKFRWKEQEIDLQLYPPGMPLKEKILEEAGSDRIMRIKFRGLIKPDEYLILEEDEKNLKRQFAYLELDDNSVHPNITDSEALFPEGTIGHHFVQLMKRKIESAAETDKKILEEALARGVSFLKKQL